MLDYSKVLTSGMVETSKVLRAGLQDGLALHMTTPGAGKDLCANGLNTTLKGKG